MPQRPRRGQTVGGGSGALGSLLAAYLMGDYGVNPEYQQAVNEEKTYGPLTPDQQARVAKKNSGKLGPIKANNIFARANANALNTGTYLDTLANANAADTELSTFSKMTPLVIQRMKEQGVLTEDQAISLLKRTQEVENANIVAKATEEAKAESITGKAKNLTANEDRINAQKVNAIAKIGGMYTPQAEEQFIGTVNPSILAAEARRAETASNAENLNAEKQLQASSIFNKTNDLVQSTAEEQARNALLESQKMRAVIPRIVASRASIPESNIGVNQAQINRLNDPEFLSVQPGQGLFNKGTGKFLEYDPYGTNAKMREAQGLKTTINETTAPPTTTPTVGMGPDWKIDLVNKQFVNLKTGKRIPMGE